jgi:peptidoglycan/xylan/chitin deacetylase (PgdA/CDA1 family)
VLRLLFFFSAAGKVAAVILWTIRPMPWASVACFCVPDLVILYHLLAPWAQWVCPAFTRFETPRKEIWLTIDDGPDQTDTPQILDLLEVHRAKATFFLIGERAAKYPGLVAEILRRGHQVGHHTQTHPTRLFWCASASRVRAEIDDGLKALRAGGAEPRWFRSPVGIKNLHLAGALGRRGLACVGWNIRSHDFKSRNPAEVVARVMRNLAPGAIVLVHEGPGMNPRVRVHAIARLLETLAGQGFACVLPEDRQLR